jgi:hypothetical protein
MSLTPGEEEFLTDALQRELAMAVESGATPGQMTLAFIAAMAQVSDVELRVSIAYPKPKPQNAGPLARRRGGGPQRRPPVLQGRHGRVRAGAGVRAMNNEETT